MPAKFVIERTPAGKYSFDLMSNSGDKVLWGYQYSSRAHCLAAIRSVKENAVYAHRFQKKNSPNGQHYFVLKQNDEDIIATSELYWSASSRDYAIVIIKREAPEASTEEVNSF